MLLTAKSIDIFSYFSMKMYVVSRYWNHLTDAPPISAYNIIFFFFLSNINPFPAEPRYTLLLQTV